MRDVNIRGSMNAEFEQELTPDQWETLKALRIPARDRRRLNGMIVEHVDLRKAEKEERDKKRR